MADSTGDETRPSLLLRLRDPRDQEAWSRFVDVYGPLVHSHARRRGLSNEDAEDVTQRVFARVSEAIRKFDYDPQRGKFRDWLGFIVRNEVFRHWKKGERETRAPGGDDQTLEQVAGDPTDPEWTEEFHTHVLRVALARCQPRFEPDTWWAFEKVWLDHFPARDVAQELSQPIDWVYVAKSRVLKRLWQEVQELADDAPLLLQRPAGGSQAAD
jgi:RNA polymerase sigma factor (sigma-70 family)